MGLLSVICRVFFKGKDVEVNEEIKDIVMVVEVIFLCVDMNGDSFEVYVYFNV